MELDLHTTQTSLPEAPLNSHVQQEAVAPTFLGVMQPVIEQAKNARNYLCNLPGFIGAAATTMIGSRQQVTEMVEEKLAKFPLGVGNYLEQNDLITHAAGRIHDIVFDTRVVFAVATPLNILTAILTTVAFPSVAGGIVGLGAGQLVAGLTRSAYLSARSLFYYSKTDKLKFPPKSLKDKYPALEPVNVPVGLPFAVLSALPLGTLMIPAVGFVGTLSGEDLNGVYQTVKENISEKPLVQKLRNRSRRNTPNIRL